MQQGKLHKGPGRTQGFTLFEMVVVICSIVILYMVAEQRLNELPAAAERANFLAVLEQVKTGVNFEMFSKVAGGNSQEARAMEASNPMSYLLETPSNYLGEESQVTDALRRRNAWYFETSSGELVYLVGGASIDDVWVSIASVPVNLGQIRFKIENIYIDSAGNRLYSSQRRESELKSSWEGVLLEPVHEFTWEKRSEKPIELN